MGEGAVLGIDLASGPDMTAVGGKNPGSGLFEWFIYETIGMTERSPNVERTEIDPLPDGCVIIEDEWDALS